MTRIAILGAGVAGVSSAIALRQKGFDVTVYERRAKPATIGAGIVLWPNACFVLEQLGMLAAMQARGGRTTAMRRFSESGEPLGTLDISLINQHMGYASLSILREDFHAVLLERLASLDVPIHYGHAITTLSCSDAGEVTLSFADGSTDDADIIIGADGRMASPTRRFVHGDNAPVYQGFVNWIGVFESATDMFDELAVSDLWGVGKRFGIVPVTARKAYWAGGAAMAAGAAPHDYQQELRALFEDWPELVRTLIDETPPARLNRIAVHDHDPIPVWHKGAVIAIGDAAHAALPTSGQGACQALEDAWHLSNCLSAHRDDAALAFEKFTALRAAKTAGITFAGRQLAGSLFNTDPTFCAERNRKSKATDFAATAAAMARGWSQNLPLHA